MRNLSSRRANPVCVAALLSAASLFSATAVAGPVSNAPAANPSRLVPGGVVSAVLHMDSGSHFPDGTVVECQARVAPEGSLAADPVAVITSQVRLISGRADCVLPIPLRTASTDPAARTALTWQVRLRADATEHQQWLQLPSQTQWFRLIPNTPVYASLRIP